LRPHPAHDVLAQEAQQTDQLAGDAMGGSFVGTARAVILCSGDDVCKNLNDVFEHRDSAEYKKAQGQKQSFLDISNGTGDYMKLHQLYLDIGVKDCGNWQAYLSTLKPDDIKHIAMARFEGLDRTKKMKTTTRLPPKGDDHKPHWKPDANGDIEINSPLVPDTIIKK
jgi:hypothetical protein